MSKLVIVSNRVVVPDGSAAHAGGLARGISHVLKRFGGLWFGWSGQTVPEASGIPRSIPGEHISYAMLDLDQRDYQEYYQGFANSTLWPLFHYPMGGVAYDRDEYQGYCRVNAKFAKALATCIEPGDLIWVHDYHLIPLGAELRRLGFRNRIGFFLHTPFPPPSVLEVLPCHGELLTALESYNLLGFQTSRDLRAFQEQRHYPKPPLDFSEPTSNGANVPAAVFGIGIEPDEIRKAAEEAGSAFGTEPLHGLLRGEKMVIGVDRLDHSKGLPNRLDAYARLLESRPEHHNRVSLLQIAPPSRSDIDHYRELGRLLEQKTGQINGRFADLDWTPIQYLNKTFNPDILAGLYRQAAVALVTPLRDGMNLVAKEYVAAQAPADPGVLILSRFAGAAQEMDAAILVNPYDIQQMADALHSALSMPLAERHSRWTALNNVVRRHTVTYWGERFIAALKQAPLTVDRKHVVKPLEELQPEVASARRIRNPTLHIH